MAYDKLKLDGRVAVVVGGTTGIGRALVAIPNTKAASFTSGSPTFPFRVPSELEARCPTS